MAIAPMPSGVYSDEDRKAEDAYCGIDFYSENVAICPKVWSTSPATMVHDLSAGSFSGRARQFETEICSKGAQAKDFAHRELATFKITMNVADTSATFSTAALLYYHFLRYLEADVFVPVAVYRSMDKQAYHDRVAVIFFWSGEVQLGFTSQFFRDENPSKANKPAVKRLTKKETHANDGKNQGEYSRLIT